MSTTVNIVASADNSTHSAVPDRNYGSTQQTINYTGVTMLRFDCSSIPVGSTIVSGYFRFVSTSGGGGGTVSRLLNLYSFTAANADWVEGTANGKEQVGSSCGTYKIYNTVSWAGSIHAATAGVDYETDKLCTTINKNGADPAGTVYTASLTEAGMRRIEGWFGATNTNYGVRMDQQDRGILGLRENATAAYRPVLSITYDTPESEQSIIPLAMAHYAKLRSN